MRSDDIQKQLEALREEVRGLSASFAQARSVDVRVVFSEQTKAILMERIERFFQQKERGSADPLGDRRLKARLNGAVEMTDRAVRGEGKEEAMLALNKLEADFLRPFGEDPDRQRFVLDLVKLARRYIEDSDEIAQEAGRMPEGRGRPTMTGTGPLSPASVEETLGPLVSSLRIRIMLILSREDERLVDLCKAMDMQKGHLQYHLKALMGQGYVRYDRKSRLYYITSRGTVALQGLAELTDNIRSA